MTPKRTRKLVQETVVEEPTQDLEAPPEAMKEEEQNHSEDEEDRDGLEEHENEEEQPNGVLFTPEQLEVLLKMNSPISMNRMRPSREAHPKVWVSSPLSSGTLTGPGIERLWMLGLRRWKITFMPPRLVGIRPWNLPNPI
jgi:hypothetical protein